MLGITRFNWKERLRASAVHLMISAAVASMAAALVFVVWYPWPYREISGGRELFLILTSVDIVLGPMVTLAIFDRAKGWPVLRRDLAFIGITQLAALAYGLGTVFEARPVYLVFEYNRFRVVHAVEIPEDALARADAHWRRLPWFGPRLLALREFRDSRESLVSTMTALQGLELSAQPHLWQAYPEARERVLKAAKPAQALEERFPAEADMIDSALRRTGLPRGSVLYLPMVGRKTFWTALIDPATADVVGFLALDSF
jgi:hypothetical protein